MKLAAFGIQIVLWQLYLLQLVSSSWNQLGFRPMAISDGKPAIVPGINYATDQHTLSGSWRMEQSSQPDRFNRAANFDAEVLVNGIPYGKSGYRGSAKLYSIEVMTGMSFLNIMANGGTGDVDLYVRYQEYPTKRTYDERSAHAGNQEQIIIDKPKPGRWYIVLYGYDNYDLVGFEAESR